MKRMLFNATQAEELRVAIVDGQKLIDLDIESAAKEQRKSNIYKGVITRIEPSLEAAFVDYGADRHGFLPFKEISRSYFQPGADTRSHIRDAIKEGQELIIQVDKDGRGNKGAALTTFISLAGRYLVLMPNKSHGGGVSRRVDGDERAELRDTLDQLDIPNGMSLIARTAAIGRQAEELQWDLNYLLQLWRAIEGVARESRGALLIYQEGSLVIRAIRDYFQPEIGEILIDTDEIFAQAQAFMAQVMPGNVNRVKRYRDDVPLFSRFQIEHQIETAFGRQVNLPSGGAIVIDHTEALVAVDVNSGRATRGADIEETAFKTNLEAAEEVARQLRLRDLGGLIVIDFIDMESAKNQREVENRLKDALKFDRARVQIGKISRFGLMELSRQRLRPALAETSYIPCPRCTGTGHIRSTESAALHILRILEEEAMKDGTAAVHVQMPVDVATFLLNEKRQDIQAIELRHKVVILLIPNIHLETPAHDIVRLKHDELNADELRDPSYKLVEAPSEEKAGAENGKTEVVRPRQEAAIKNVVPDRPAPIVQAPPEANASGILSRIISWFKSSTPAPTPAAPTGRKNRDGGRRTEQARGERGETRRNNKNRNEARRGEERDNEKTDKANGERQNRNERGGERTRARGDRNETRNENRAESRNENRAENNRSENNAEPAAPRERKPREPRRERPQAVEPVVPENQDTPTQAADGGDESNHRRSRNRRGRGRNNAGETAPNSIAADVSENASEHRDLVPVSEAVVSAPVEPAPAPVEVAAAKAVVAPVEIVREPLVTRVPVEPVEAITARDSDDNAPFAEPPVSASVSPLPLTEAPGAPPVVDAAPPEAVPTPPVMTSLINLEAELKDSGLVLVQTADNIASPRLPTELARPRGRPRRHQPPAALEEESLVMVETQQ
ncbi:MAG: Rne/Rng family ribonuclease [Zoogloeaceae bacterium]|jgi:ribonuclease E|nr:Rne/Rng family ribonuclease [Zoogloeaceae bacterium]